MIQILQSKWVAVVVGAIAYWGATVAAFTRHKFEPPPRPAETVPETSVVKGPSWEFLNPELERLIAELKEQRDEVGKRSKDLDDLQARLAAERQEITSTTQIVWRLRTELDRALVRIKDEEVTNLKRLARVYGSMSPEGAARVLGETEEEQAVKVLASMKDTQSGPILESMSKVSTEQAKRAAALANRLRLLTANQPPAAKPDSSKVQ